MKKSKKIILAGGIELTTQLKQKRKQNFLNFIKEYQKMVLTKTQ